MKHSRRLVSLLLLLAVTAGSVSALEAPDTQNVAVSDTAETVENSKSTIHNSAPTISLRHSNTREENGIFIYTNFSEFSGPSGTEEPLLYRASKNGKFKALPKKDTGSRPVCYYYDSKDPSRLFVADFSCKNGHFYRYKLAVMLTDSSGKSSPVAYSKVKSYYYLDPMLAYTAYSKYLSIKNSANKKTMTISWKKQCNPKADGYQLRYYHYIDSANPIVSELITRTVKGAKTSKYTLKHRSPNRQYWVQIRSYKKYKGKTYYSNWSEFARRY